MQLQLMVSLFAVGFILGYALKCYWVDAYVENLCITCENNKEG